MAAFYDREKEQEELGVILESEPSVVYFISGPINSGKTTLLIKVLNDLPPKYLAFYINLRGRDVSSSGEFLNVLFSVDRKSRFDTARDYLREFAKGGIEILRKTTGIPIPVSLFDLLFRAHDKGADAFKYLEEFFTTLVHDNGMHPVFVLDELQVIRNVANNSGNLLLEKLFNFFVRMTKETHLCQCLAATSDCLFIEEVYGNARLQGRCRYFFVDDLDKKRAIEVYNRMGFKDVDMIWDYIGGKLGDMILLAEGKRLKADEMETAREMLQTEVMRIRMFLRKAEIITMKVAIEGESKEVNVGEIKETLTKVIENRDVMQYELSELPLRLLIEENILFLNPQTGKVGFQGRLIEKAVKTLKDQKYLVL